MSYRFIDEALVRDLLRRWQSGESLHAIARATGIDRKTVRRYARVAEAVRMAATSPLDDETISGIVWVVQRPPLRVSEGQHALASQHGRIRSWLAMRASLTDIHARLERLGITTSYATLRRFAIDECGFRVRTSGPRRASGAGVVSAGHA